MSSRRLTLVASFDDLCRNTAVLTKGIETNFIDFVTNQERCRIRWLEAEQRLEQLQIQFSRLEADNDVLRTKLKHVRNDLSQEMKRRTICEQEKASLERQIQLVRELLLNDHQGRSMLNEERLAFLNDSRYKNKENHERLSVIDESADISMSDISYDKSEECLDVSYLRSGRRWKRRRRTPSAPPVELDDRDGRESSPKRARAYSGERSQRRDGDHNTSITTTTTIKVPVSTKSVLAHAEIQTDNGTKSISYDSRSKKNHRRSKSTGSELTNEKNQNGNNFSHQRVASSDNLLKDQITPVNSPLVRTNSSSSRLNKGHIFITKTAIRPEHCCVCNKRLNFGARALKCRDCRATSHPDCKDRVPLPCIPTTPATPGLSKNNIGVIADYAPLDSPMIPALVIMCCREVEARGLNEPGIYRVPGSDRDAKELKDKFFRRKGSPNLAMYNDIHVICCTLKLFLRGLKESLITFDLWNEFVSATERADRDEALCQLYQAVSMLPQANRDTLAYLILHLKKVAFSEGTKMPVANLAKVLGPTMVGYSCPEPTPMQMITETKKQANVLEMLMGVEDTYWSAFIADPEPIYRSMQPGVPQTPQTPEPRGDCRSILGPVSSHTKPRDHGIGITPRFKKNGPRHFFSSPSLN